MKEKYYLYLITAILFLVSLFLHKDHTSSVPIQQGIAKEIIRFHVKANSNSEEDQRLKLIVKDELNHFLSPYLSNINDINKAREMLQQLLPDIQKNAYKIILEQGYNYSVNVNLEQSYFPIKSYGNYTFPPGIYEALKVDIGNASGNNWWCLMFPPLCLVDETYSIIPKDSEDKLKIILTEEEFEEINKNNLEIKYKFKLLEMFKNLLK